MPPSTLKMGAAYLTSGVQSLLYPRGPVFVTFFITSRCNLKCAHCFYWANLNREEPDLTLDEIEKISLSMAPFQNLLLSGGEPFMRKDIADLVSMLVRNNKVYMLTIPTSGFFTDRTVESAERIARECPQTEVHIQLSIDGLKERHDEIRKVPGSFAKLMETYRQLHELELRLPNLHPTFLFTFMRYNQEQAIDVFDYLKRELKCRYLNMNLVRGDAREPDTLKPDPDLYRQAADYLLALSGPQDGSRPSFFERVYWYRHRQSYEYIHRNYTDGYQVPCLAGHLNAVIDEVGKVYTCEILEEPIGDLRESGYDFQKIWRGPQATERRRWIKDTHCVCTHETNVATNVTFNVGCQVKNVVAALAHPAT
jgi:MoaA/NifB/PqqE/SkfB family radical SAM enzyme